MTYFKVNVQDYYRLQLSTPSQSLITNQEAFRPMLLIKEIYTRFPHLVAKN